MIICSLPYFSTDVEIKKTALKQNIKYEGWNFNSGNYLFTTDTK